MGLRSFLRGAGMLPSRSRLLTDSTTGVGVDCHFVGCFKTPEVLEQAKNHVFGSIL